MEVPAEAELHTWISHLRASPNHWFQSWSTPCAWFCTPGPSFLPELQMASMSSLRTVQQRYQCGLPRLLVCCACPNDGGHENRCRKRLTATKTASAVFLVSPGPASFSLKLASMCVQIMEILQCQQLLYLSSSVFSSWFEPLAAPRSLPRPCLLLYLYPVSAEPFYQASTMLQILWVSVALTTRSISTSFVTHVRSNLIDLN